MTGAGRLLVACPVAVLVVVSAGCSSPEQTSGSAEPAPPPTSFAAPPGASSAPDSTASAPAPPVPEPVRVAERLLKDPCATLRTDQVAALGVPDDDGGNRRTTPRVVAQCYWGKSANGPNSMSVAWELANRSGLDDIYAQRDTFSYFIPTRVARHPAVVGSPNDGRAMGNCSLHVGVSESLSMLVQYQKPDQWRIGCERAKRVAVRVLETVGGGE